MLTTFSKYLIPILELIVSIDFLLIIRNPFYPKYKRIKYYYLVLLMFIILIIFRSLGINEFEDRDHTNRYNWFIVLIIIFLSIQTLI